MNKRTNSKNETLCRTTVSLPLHVKQAMDIYCKTHKISMKDFLTALIISQVQAELEYISGIQDKKKHCQKQC
jgi:hypothetical protein